MLEKFKYANLPLQKKVLFPYILLLLTLAMAIAIGSNMLLQGGLIDIAQKRLKHVQQQAYKDYKNLELLLAQDNLKNLSPTPEAIGELQKTIVTFDQHVRIMLTRADDPKLSAQQQALLKKSLPHESAYISVIDDPQQGHSLIACQRLSDNQFLLIQHPLGLSHLNHLADHYESDFYLLNQQGKILSSNHAASADAPQLTQSDLATVLAGNSLSKIIENNGKHLITYSALPLGHDEVYLLATAQSLSSIESLINNHRLYLLIIIGLSLLICIIIYRSLVLRLFSPLDTLLSAAGKIKNGEYAHRIETVKNSQSQLVKLGNGYNHLLDELDIQKQKIAELSGQQEKIEELKTHNRHLRKSNLELETRTIALKEQNQDFSALFKVTQTMVSSLDQHLLYERIIQAIKDSLNCSVSVLYIFQPTSDNLLAAKVQGIYGIDLKSVKSELGEGQAGKTAIEQNACYLPDISQQQDKPTYGNEVISKGSLLSVPMTVQNRLIGVLNLHQAEPNGFSNSARQIAQAIANQAAIAIENARLYEKTKMLSATDELTGLSNRRQFQEYLLRELAQSRRQHNPFSILMVDIDHFKLYNDFHGHLKGDIVLKKVASLLVQNTRGIDLVARFGGEEFVLLLPKSDKQNSLSVAEKLRMCIEKEYFAGAENSQPGQRLTISVGVSHLPDDSNDIYDLMNLADNALYAAKNRGRNTCVGWDSSLLPVDRNTQKKGP